MKKILYLGYAVDPTIQPIPSGMSVAGNKMQANMLYNFSTDVELKIVTVPPVTTWPKDKKICYKSEIIDIGRGLKAETVGFINIPLIKQAMQIRGVYKKGKKYLKENPDAVVFPFNMYPQVGDPAIKLKRKCAAKVVPILADLPIDCDYSRNGLKKLIRDRFDNKTKSNIKNVDKAVVLNKHAIEMFAPGKEYVIVEGGINQEDYPDYKSSLHEIKPLGQEKRLVYGGSLADYSGVKNLVDAMDLVENQDVVLHIYGGGSLENYIRGRESTRVKFHGSVSNEEMIKIQASAWALVNPRPTDDAIAQVTFPSKLFEYMMSGTPVLTTRLNGLTEQYFDKMMYIDDESKEGMAKAIDVMAKTDFEQLNEMAKNAQEFVYKHKNWKRQMSIIEEFLFS